MRSRLGEERGLGGWGGWEGKGRVVSGREPLLVGLFCEVLVWLGRLGEEGRVWIGLVDGGVGEGEGTVLEGREQRGGGVDMVVVFRKEGGLEG